MAKAQMAFLNATNAVGFSTKPSYAKVTDEEQTEDPIELPVEPDGTISLSTVTAQFAGASGLKYRNPETGTFRGLRVDDHARIHPPSEDWGGLTFVVVYPKENTKRKIDIDHVESNAPASKQKRVEREECSDLVVLGLPYKTTGDEMRRYFEQFGEVLLSQVKKDPVTQKSRGFGYVRFVNYGSQVKVLSQAHQIDGRWCTVKNAESQSTSSRKVFVRRLNESITPDDLRYFFVKFGEITDVFIPPFRNFGYVTFADRDVAQRVCGKNYVIGQCTVDVSLAIPKESCGISNNTRSAYPYAVGGPTGGGGYPNRLQHPAPDRRGDCYSYPSGPVSPQAKMNRDQVRASFPSSTISRENDSSYSNPLNVVGSGNGGSNYQMPGGGGPISLASGSSSGCSMTPVPPSQPPPPQPSSAVVLPTSANSQSAASSATNQALDLGSCSIGSLLTRAVNPALDPALFATAQDAILQVLLQTSQLSGSPMAADISSALLGATPAAAQMAQGQPGGPQEAGAEPTKAQWKGVPEPKEDKPELSGSKTGSAATPSQPQQSNSLQKGKGRQPDGDSSIIVAAEPISLAIQAPKVDSDDVDLGHTSHHSLKPGEGSLRVAAGKKKALSSKKK